MPNVRITTSTIPTTRKRGRAGGLRRSCRRGSRTEYVKQSLRRGRPGDDARARPCATRPAPRPDGRRRETGRLAQIVSAFGGSGAAHTCGSPAGRAPRRGRGGRATSPPRRATRRIAARAWRRGLRPAGPRYLCDHRVAHPDPPRRPSVDRFEPNLRIPGPTALPPSVREAGARQMINHRGPEFAAMLERILTGMKPFFGTTSDVAMLTCAGSGGLEAAVVNTLSPGDRVLGGLDRLVRRPVREDRRASTARTVTKIEVEWGQAADPAAVREALTAPRLPGRPADPQRDLDRRHEPDPRPRRSHPRRRPRRAHPRRQRVGPGSRPVRDGRLGRRRRRHRLAEGVDGRARAWR